MNGRGLFYKFIYIAWMVMLLWPRGGIAGEEWMTLDSCWQEVLANNPTLHAASMRHEGRAHREKATGLDMLPSVDLKYAWTDPVKNSLGNEATAYGSSTVTVSQPLYDSALWSRWQEAGLQTEMAQMDEVWQRHLLKREVKAVWFSWLKAREAMRLSEESLQRLKEHERNAEAFFEAGRMWSNDVSQAKVRVVRGKGSLLAAKNEEAIMRTRLNKLMNRRPDNVWSSKEVLQWQPLPWSLEQAQQLALAKRWDLQKARLQQKLGEQAEQTTWGTLKPTLSLDGSLNWRDGMYRGQGKIADHKVMLTLNWMAWEWGKGLQEVAAAKAETRARSYNYLELKESVLVQVQEAFFNAEAFAGQVEFLKQALLHAEENWRVNTIRYQEKIGTATDVLNALDLLNSTRLDYTTTLARYLTSLAEVELAIGDGELSGDLPGKT